MVTPRTSTVVASSSSNVASITADPVAAAGACVWSSPAAREQPASPADAAAGVVQAASSTCMAEATVLSAGSWYSGIQTAVRETGGTGKKCEPEANEKRTISACTFCATPV